MTIDGYTPCPGGTGKKIKFCCSELLGDFEKLNRMLEGEQYQAGLNHLDTLLAKSPDRACLLAMQSMLLRVTDQWDAAHEVADKFTSRHPDNPLAWGEAAIVTAHREGGVAAMPALQRALAVTGAQIEQRVYLAMGEVAEALVADGEPMAALALLLVQHTLDPDDSSPAEMLVELAASPEIPLLIKSERQLGDAPADASWKSTYDEALAPTSWGCWSVAAERVAALLEQVGDQPLLWRTLATLRGWLADTKGCAEALQKYASLDVALEDAVEALALALLLSEDPLGDSADILSVTFAVQDAESLQTALAQSKQLSPANVDLMRFAEGDQPPPKGVYFLCDRAAPESGVELTLENVPRMYCQALLFGRQTDREARLELRGLRQERLEVVRDLLRTVAGDSVGEPVEQKVDGKVSQTQDLMVLNFRLPADVDARQIRRLSDAHREDALLNRWIQLPLGLLDGKTPQEAATLEAYRVRVLGAIMLMATWFESRPEGMDLNRVREKLGLPTLGPLDLQQVDLRTLPLVRFARGEADKVDDDRLVELFHVATSYNVGPALKRVSQAVLDRSSLAEANVRREACAVMVRAEGPSDRGIEYIEMGRQMAKSQKQSCAAWDLMELSYRYARVEAEQLVRVMNHVQSQHLREPGIPEALMRFLVRIGMVHPDGTPAMPPGGAVSEPAAAPAAPGPEPGKLWTPESQRPAEERKIWMPGME